MKGRNYWREYIEYLRKREIEIVSGYFGNMRFKKGLEIGAGNGFQSKLLINFVEYLTCTELNEFRLNKKNDQNITYMICDADKINSYFENQNFDFIFSAHLLEHLVNPEKAIEGIYKLLNDNGFAIHIIPSSLNAFLRIILWYPNLIRIIFQKLFLKNHKQVIINQNIKRGNNLKSIRSYNKSKLRKHIIPRPHGVSKNIFIELIAFSKKRWINEFSKQNFTILKIIRGPVHSGYGFGFNKLREIMNSIGFAGEYIYIMRKNEE